MEKLKILVVEDEEKIRILLRLYLEQNDYQVAVVNNGKEALATINEEMPDLLIVDIIMPEMNGIELCRELRKDSKFEAMPIIFLSGLNEKQWVISGLEFGADDYITKPFDPNELIARINANLRRTKRKRETFKSKYEALTEQEKNILKLMEKGLTNKEIATKLFLTEGTIKVYNHNLFQKLQVKNRTQAIVAAKGQNN